VDTGAFIFPEFRVCEWWFSPQSFALLPLTCSFFPFFFFSFCTTTSDLTLWC
jgi:hypothetical protein